MLPMNEFDEETAPIQEDRVWQGNGWTARVM
jgi:hypothetical protein